MKTKFAHLALIAALGASGVTTAFAHEDISDGASTHWLSHVEAQQPTANQLAPYGYATAGPAERVVDIQPGTKFLNVTRLETVRINVGGKSVIWTFDTLGTRSFPLSKIVPGAESIMVYVDEHPFYRGG